MVDQEKCISLQNDVFCFFCFYWLCWVFIAACRLSVLGGEVELLFFAMLGFSWQSLPVLLHSMGSRHLGSEVVVHGLS